VGFIISICIPTYNRVQKIKDFCLSFNHNKYPDVSISIYDNYHLSLFENESFFNSNIFYARSLECKSGPVNILSSLKYSNGTYSFLLLDKDSINWENFDSFYNHLKQESSTISCGYIDNSKGSVAKMFDPGFDSIYNIAFKSLHPSGLFFKSDLLLQGDYFNHVINNDVFFGFHPDIILADLSQLGKSLIYRKEVICIESPEESAAYQSISFKTFDSLFMSPLNRLMSFRTYCNHVLIYSNLEKNKVLVLITQIFMREFNFATFQLKRYFNDRSIINHYKITTKDIKSNGILKNAILFLGGADNILSKLGVNIVLRCFILIYGSLRVLLSNFRYFLRII